MSAGSFSCAAERNGPPILGVLRRELAHSRTVLEIGSGTGQHAVAFAKALGHLAWQPSDLAEHRVGIRARLADSAVPNVLDPLELDVRTDELPEGVPYDAAFSANTAHILSADAVRSMFALVAASLRTGGKFCLYGPFRQGGEFNSASNAGFDASLRARDPAMGIRDLEELDAFGLAGGLQRRRLYAMPANNQLTVWRKSAQDRRDDHA